jgi:hypothetical protein
MKLMGDTAHLRGAKVKTQRTARYRSGHDEVDCVDEEGAGA